MYNFPSSMAQNFWIAIFAWSTCFLVTIAVSLATSPKADKELEGLVWGLTKQPSEKGVVWYMRPGALALVVLAIMSALNLLFW
jgi:SSS family solute:Na+ symporter